jgi:PBP1b-binding outer membrane lipoprotein LpoB
MKIIKVCALLLAVVFLAASCSQNHYAKTKRKVTKQNTEMAPVADNK